MGTVSYCDVVGFPGYCVGSDGSVWSRWAKKGLGYGKGTTTILSETWRELRPVKANRYGHVHVTLAREGKHYARRIHRLVLEHFVGPCPDGMEGCHNDGNPLNNTVGNLRWDTRKGNAQDAITHRTVAWGERCASSKLTNAQVIEIRRRLKVGENRKAIAEEHGVTDTAISYIQHNKTYKYLSDIYYAKHGRG